MTKTPVKNPARTPVTSHVWGASRALDLSKKALATNQIGRKAVTQIAIKARSLDPPTKGAITITGTEVITKIGAIAEITPATILAITINGNVSRLF